MKKQLLFLPLCCAVFTFASCYYDKADLLYPGSNAAADCSTVSAGYAANVAPLISSKCASSGCHDNSAAGGISLTNYTQVKANATRIQVRAIDEKTMPTSGPLTSAEIAILKCWIDGGMLNN
ncbi:MAG: hypothetical protein RLY16_1190 [Bacteroidota bacterium]|jgi:uncharacterized membrane protein